MARMRREKNPMQPVQWDTHRVIRFKGNKIVQFLVDWCAGLNGHVGYPKLSTPTDKAPDLNTLAVMDFSDDDRTQFAQLIGYSVSGAGDLSYFDRRVLAKADAIATALSDQRRRRGRRSDQRRKLARS